MTYLMDLKVTKFREDLLNRFEIFSENPQGGHFAPNSVNSCFNLAVWIYQIYMKPKCEYSDEVD